MGSIDINSGLRDLSLIHPAKKGQINGISSALVLVEGLEIQFIWSIFPETAVVLLEMNDYSHAVHQGFISVYFSSSKVSLTFIHVASS